LQSEPEADATGPPEVCLYPNLSLQGYRREEAAQVSATSDSEERLKCKRGSGDICCNMKAKLGPWAHRSLVLLAAGLIVLSGVTPWWTTNIQAVYGYGSSWITIYAYGLTHNATLLREFVRAYEGSPALMSLAKIFVFANAALCALSVLVKKKWTWRLLALSGLAYLVYSVGFIPVIYEGTGRAPIPGERFPVQGEIVIHTEFETLKISSSFQYGYYLALLSASLCIALALARRSLLGDHLSRT